MEGPILLVTCFVTHISCGQTFAYEAKSESLLLSIEVDTWQGLALHRLLCQQVQIKHTDISHGSTSCLAGTQKGKTLPFA